MILLLILVIWFGLVAVPLVIGRKTDALSIVRIILWIVLVILFLQGAVAWR